MDNIIYRKADINDIDDLVDFKIKQYIFYNNLDGIVMKDESLIRENIKKVLLQELNKTIYFFIAINEKNNKAIACNGVIVHQMVPSQRSLNGKKAYITSVYTDEEYRRKRNSKCVNANEFRIS